MKRALAVLSIWILLITSPAGGWTVLAAESAAAPAFEDNALYSGEKVEAAYSTAAAATADVNTGEAVYYAEGEALYRSMKRYLLQRAGSFTLHVVTAQRMSTKSERLGLVRRLFFAATDDQRSDRVNDGDYLRLAVAGYGYTAFTEDRHTGGLYYYTVTASVTYYSTAAQEQQVDKAVARFVSELNTKALTDYQRLTRVHTYICDRAVYDSKAAADPTANPAAFSAYGALLGGKATCQGYAAAFFRIARALGYRTRIITSAKNAGNHAWNLIALNGVYYAADLTWDDEAIDGRTGKGDLYCFLVTAAALQQYDSAAKEHTPDPLYFDTDYFNENYQAYAAVSGYDAAEERLLSNCILTPQLGGKADSGQYAVRTPAGVALSEGRDYRTTTCLLYGKSYRCLEGIGRYEGSTLRRCTVPNALAKQPKFFDGQ
ncbi:MAG: hypothetical protein IJ168_02720 [Eubacterium sp.]|nr:hypothetical protein [Eubacterium sp.]